MSKDEFPPSLTSEMVLHQTFEFMEEWKSRLYDMLSFNTAQVRNWTGLLEQLHLYIFLSLVFLKPSVAWQGYILLRPNCNQN